MFVTSSPGIREFQIRRVRIRRASEYAASLLLKDGSGGAFVVPECALLILLRVYPCKLREIYVCRSLLLLLLLLLLLPSSATSRSVEKWGICSTRACLLLLRYAASNGFIFLSVAAGFSAAFFASSSFFLCYAASKGLSFLTGSFYAFTNGLTILGLSSLALDDINLDLS